MKTLLNLTLTAMFFFALGNSNGVAFAPEGKVKHVNAKDAAKLLKEHPEVIVLDIRTPKEYKAGHLAKARNIDYYEDDFESNLKKLDRSKTYLVHCASGGRSGKSLKMFKKLDFKSIVHLDGGYKGWVKSGLPVKK